MRTLIFMARLLGATQRRASSESNLKRFARRDAKMFETLTAFFVLLACLCISSASPCYAQRQTLTDRPYGEDRVFERLPERGVTRNSASNSSEPLFVPSLDAKTSTLASAVDSARRNRPPEPSKKSEDLYYPEGFLTLSSPTPEPVVNRPKANVEEVDKPGDVKPKDKGEPIRPLDPGMETTPLSVDRHEPVVEEEAPRRHTGRDRFFFFAISVALAGLGVFLYNDFRYRDQLRADLVRNAKLCSPNAQASDFDDVLAADADLVDPRAPSFVNPHYDADVILYGDPDQAGKTLQDPAFDDYKFEVSEAISHVGPSLHEENFDFTPSGVPATPAVDLDEVEFVVGVNSSESLDNE